MRRTRREFIASSTPAIATGFTIMSSPLALKAQANSALSVGLIGCGRRGTAITRYFAQNEFAKVAALCDIYDDQLQAASQKFSGAKMFKDIHDVLSSDVDAVYIATPPYLHPEHFELAAQAKKHIFMEKPCGVDPAGCRRLLEASKKADKTKRISIDFQQRYGKDYRKAFEIVKSGQLGKIVQVRASWLGGGLPVREGVKQDEELVRNWLFYREHSGDIIVEQDCHNLDVVNWFMNDMHPSRAEGYGGRMVRKSPGNILDNLAATFIFDNSVIFSYAANQISQGGNDVSETFYCENGTIRTSRQGYTLWHKGQKQPEQVATNYDITKDAVDEFVDGARNGKMENAALTAVPSTLTAIMARESIYKNGAEMSFDNIAAM